MRAIIGMGSNLGNSVETLQQVVTAFGRVPHIRVTAVSSIYETAPVGYTDQPSFFNAVCEVETDLPAEGLLGVCLGIESALGRVRTFSNAPRVIDVDVLLCEGVTAQTEALTLPHPRMHERAFVLVPLAELYPQQAVYGWDFSAHLERVGGLNTAAIYRKLPQTLAF